MLRSNQTSIRNDKISKNKVNLISEVHIFISQGHIEPTLAYITTTITETTHTNIHSLEHSTTWDGLAQINL